MNPKLPLNRWISDRKTLIVGLAGVLILAPAVCRAAIPASRVGDVNGDGALTVRDAQLALRDALGLQTLSADQRAIASFGGKKPTKTNATSLLKASLGLEALVWGKGGGLLDGPCFLPDGSLVFTDYERHGLFALAPDGKESLYADTKGNPGEGRMREDGHIIVAQFDGNVVDVAPDRTVTVLAKAPKPRAYGGPSGVALGPNGRIYFSGEGSGEVYLLTSDGTVKPVLKTTGLPTGVALSDDRHLYVADAKYHKIAVYALDEDGLPVDDGTLFAKINTPLRIVFDKAGNLWTAGYAENHLYVFDPNGVRIRRFDIPASRVTSVAFGPSGSHQVFVTSATPGTISILRLDPNDPLAKGLP